MKLLIIAQKVDQKDAVFSFFHRWIIELAKHYESVNVICLFEGSHSLPANVKVHSLGKDEFEKFDSHRGPSPVRTARGLERIMRKLHYVKRFYELAWILRHEYDAVFVHQNQEYAILGGLLWQAFGRPVYMWRNHYAGSLLTDVAALFCTKIFCTSAFSYTAKFKQTVFMPVGVDTDVFKPAGEVNRVQRSILSLGRIAPSKKIDQLIEALAILTKERVDFFATIVGEALPQDAAFLESMKRRVKELDVEERVIFKPGVPNDETPAIYAAHDISVNQSPSGMFDKTIFEAMACETLAVSCNKNLTDKIDSAYLFKENDVNELATKLTQLLKLTCEERDARGQALRKFAEEHHSLSRLGSRLAEEMNLARGQ